MPKVDYIIVGTGLAGSILGYELLKENKTILFIANSSLPTSSRVAGGLINPVTGKYLGKTWLAEELFDVVNQFYPEIEQKFGTHFYHQTGLFRPFTSPEHQKSSLAQVEKHQLHHYIQIQETSAEIKQFYNAELGGMFTPQAGWLDIPAFLDTLKNYFEEVAEVSDEAFEFERLLIKEDSVEYKGITADKIIFCEGFYVKDNPYFNTLPFNPVKGETLLGEVDNYAVRSIVNQGKWLIPLGGNKVRLGATYSWHELDFAPTEKGKEDLLNQANKILKADLRINEQQAGVRPATKDRRPMIGYHPQHANLCIFNGLGTKGVTLAPYFAKKFVQNLVRGEVIHPEANIERFYSLFS